ncbi:DUF5103 domain-containing protein [Muribaculaceae bacterium Isolate-002 (NCI)]|nr:DUF5103 domain-containing protein [Muribaculaceae bacterium Isolate-002 (NCI)]
MVRTTAVILSFLAAAAMTAADTMTGIFDDAFHTLRTDINGDYMAPPVLLLDSPDQLTISFDEITESNSYLRYSLVHCNANWTESPLVESEFLDGFNFGNVDDYEYSRMTSAHYVNYRITLPNDRFRFKISGNYLVRVYRDDDPDTTLLQARFMVSESTATVQADVLSVTDIDYNDSHQQVSVTVDATNAKVEDVFNDLMVYVSQNGRLDNEVMVRQPLRVSGKKAFYEHLRQLIFPAGNEYRRMETVSTTYPGMNVEAVEYHDPYYHATLTTDYPRSAGSYIYDQTQSGRFFIREYNSSDSDTEADYVVTHFSLDAPELPGKHIFLDGDLTGRRFDPQSLMTYNRATGRYEKTLLLKQGAYNYQYLTIDAGGGSHSGSTSTIEGDFYQTRNEYLVKVYTRRRGERYDRLIGVTSVIFH